MGPTEGEQWGANGGGTMGPTEGEQWGANGGGTMGGQQGRKERWREVIRGRERKRMERGKSMMDCQ